ncbi:MAG: glycoside hydrolase family 3 protein [Candidatus Algichlamydia australiensis]|nr:glycoside hydrolase family 3 protein [Chlamydiales bacterium]
MKKLFLFFLTLPLFGHLEEDVGQLLMTYTYPSEEQALVQDLHIGGIIYYSWANELLYEEEVRDYSAYLQSLAETPLFIAVDQEGGRVSRLQGEFLQIPSAQFFGEIDDPYFHRLLLDGMTEQMCDAGINLNFAPVVDVNNNPENIVIGDRSFGSDAKSVVSCAKQVIASHLLNGVFPCLKHFPGHGDTSVDSHFEVPVVRKSREELDRAEFYPYFALAKEVPFIMTAHILFPELDPDYPATFSKKILTGLLREEMGFEGVIITDSLKMKAAGEEISMGEAAVRAFQAGADILLIGGKLLLGEDDEEHLLEVRGVRDALVNAIQSGRISQERLQSSLDRIANTKATLRKE